MNKISMLGISVSLVIVILLVGSYLKFGKYLPSLHHDAPLVLSQPEIKAIKKQSPITGIKVYKSQRQLKLFHDQQVLRTYPVRLGFSPQGHKIQEGDGKTPEGRYQIDWRNPASAFYKSLHVSYPNEKDRNNAQKLHVSPGGNIMIHGSATTRQMQVLPQLRSYLPQGDWTWGCIAVRNRDMDEIWQLVDNGISIEIYP